MILLTWNRDHEADTWPNYDDYLNVNLDGAHIIATWTVRSGIRIEDVEDVFMFIQGEQHPRGLIAAGWITGEPEEVPHFENEAAAEGRKSGRIRWVIESMLPKDTPVPLEALESQVPDIKWRHLYYSGVRVPPECEEQLRAAWDNHVDLLNDINPS